MHAYCRPNSWMPMVQCGGFNNKPWPDPQIKYFIACFHGFKMADCVAKYSKFFCIQLTKLFSQTCIAMASRSIMHGRQHYRWKRSVNKTVHGRVPLTNLGTVSSENRACIS